MQAQGGTRRRSTGQAPQPALRDRYGAFVLQLLANVATGLAVGIGFGIGHAIAG